ncbi:MAG: MFS transporter [Rickettsia endosymbiont of Bryobia graminum]|nr:MFS transporter [Rickettsia endosymbiont of Bryobia graminum]
MHHVIRASDQAINYQTKLTKKQKEAIGLMSIGTFLEYFDFMLYIHMAVLLNELFFAPSHSFTTSLEIVFAFCSTYLLRPIGALIFGWLGDHIGRKQTVIITTFMMAGSCFTMAILPTYAQIGITATWLVIICRSLQGLSSVGEFTGASLYLTEIMKPPIQYPMVSIVGIAAGLGSAVALGVASFSISYGFNWRYAFWFGGVIAIIGAITRSRLRETPEFVNAKKHITNIRKNNDLNSKEATDQQIVNKKINKTSLAMFLMQCSGPITIYFVYFYCANILKTNFHYSGEQVIYNNFIVSCVSLIGLSLLSYVSYYIYPLKILRLKLIIFLLLTTTAPYILSNANSGVEILYLQIAIKFFGMDTSPALPILYRNLPIFKRYTYSSFTQAMSRVIMYITTAFGCTYLLKYLGDYGVLLITVPICIAYHWGLNHFIKLEKHKI